MKFNRKEKVKVKYYKIITELIFNFDFGCRISFMKNLLITCCFWKSKFPRHNAHGGRSRILIVDFIIDIIIIIFIFFCLQCKGHTIVYPC